MRCLGVNCSKKERCLEYTENSDYNGAYDEPDAKYIERDGDLIVSSCRSFVDRASRRATVRKPVVEELRGPDGPVL